MAGRKHYLQQMGMQVGQKMGQINDPIERDFAFKSMQATPYCKHCGKVILRSFEDEQGMQIDAEWEMKNLAHYKCHLAWETEMRAKAEQQAKEEQRRREEEARNFDWDAYMTNLMKKKEE